MNKSDQPADQEQHVEPGQGVDTAQTPGIIDRTVLNLRTVWRGITTLGFYSDRLNLRPDLPGRDVDVLRRYMHECLEGRGGDVSSRARAAILGESYLNLNDQGRRRFHLVLAQDFDVDHDHVQKLAAKLAGAGDSDDIVETEKELRDALRPKRVELLTQLNSLPSGVKFLVDLREDLRRFQDDDSSLIRLDEDLTRLLRTWFDVGFLELTRITWNSPAALLEKLIHYEAVHAIQSWDDLKNRLQSDRRVFAFFHPSMPEEPLIFVSVALVKDIADNVQVLLDQSAPLMDSLQANTAIFYSITNAQRGLAGVSLGNFLIKRVVDDLKRDFPNIKTFATLSPIPEFRRYIEGLEQNQEQLLTAKELNTLSSTEAWPGSLTEVLDNPEWFHEKRLAEALRKPLMRICACYLVNEKRRGRAMDSVANFHLNNGARLEQINWLADTSQKGLLESAGIMANYLYKLNDIDHNHEMYRETAVTIASSAVRGLLPKSHRDHANAVTGKR